MMRKKILLLTIFSLLITSFSPYMFAVYFVEKPAYLTQASLFGGPFPFAEQIIILPNNDENYPIEIQFASPFIQETKFHALPFLLTFTCFFLLHLALISIIIRFFRNPYKTTKDDL